MNETVVFRFTLPCSCLTFFVFDREMVFKLN